MSVNSNRLRVLISFGGSSLVEFRALDFRSQHGNTAKITSSVLLRDQRTDFAEALCYKIYNVHVEKTTLTNSLRSCRRIADKACTKDERVARLPARSHLGILYFPDSFCQSPSFRSLARSLLTEQLP